MAEITPVHPIRWNGMTIHWWQFLKAPKDRTPVNALQRIDQLAALKLNLIRIEPLPRKPSSFGVYLGSFGIPLTKEQERLINQWDMLVVDPFQVGVSEAICFRKHAIVLGRVDLDKILDSQDPGLGTVEKIEDILLQKFARNSFSGVLLAKWEDSIAVSLQWRLFEALSNLGLLVYLEVKPPEFLKNREILQHQAVAGLVIQNASILPHGEKRDYFQMKNLQPTVKTFVSEACTRPFSVFAWERVADGVVFSNAVIRRSIEWCNFYSIIPWIGSESTLYHAEDNTPRVQPLSAFGWLKETEVIKAHGFWRSNYDITSVPNVKYRWEALQTLFPTVKDFIESTDNNYIPVEDPASQLREPLGWTSQVKSRGHLLSFLTNGEKCDSLGCFPLGSDSNTQAFSEILKSQQRLKCLGLLCPVPTSEIQKVGALLRKFKQTNYRGNEKVSLALNELSHFALNGALRVNLALDSGLKKTTNVRFWAVHQLENDGMEVFVSKNACSIAGTILHTFLSAKGFCRNECFEIETTLAKFSQELVPNTNLPRRLVKDINALSPQERLALLIQLSYAETKDDLSKNLCFYIRNMLIDATSLIQLRDVNTAGYLEQSVSPEELIKGRISWYKAQQCRSPSFEGSSSLFHQVDRVFHELLRENREHDLATITNALCELIKEGQIDAYTDMMVLALICAARKYAFDEIYSEVTDRNPLFNNQPDQAATFAESFALGSRCEVYFDMPPSAFGKLLANRFRSYYTSHQPPTWVNGAPEMATAYSGAQIDVDPNEKPRPMRTYQRFTFMSVFAIPALIDVILLSIIGRGLYLSAFMTHEEQYSATLALMISLLISGATGTWIACGGPYYLVSMAFAAANMFVLIRLFAGIAFTLAGGLIGFVIISAVQNPRSGIVFWLYLVSLTIYFCTFASLASFSYPGSAFLSGRKAILLCIPISFLSPIISTFAGNDLAIYLVVLYFLTGVLLLCLRSATSKWMTWYQAIRYTDDSEIREWYISTHGSNNNRSFDEMSDPAVLKIAREALLNDVKRERFRWIVSNPTNDQLIKELARDWESTNFLLDWYCRYADVPRPIPFSSSWNIQTKVALDTLKGSQKGLRLHNAFIHWRQSSNEIGCGVLFFVIALLDKWIQLLCGDHLLGLTGPLHDASRKAVGFALAYYLMGAILIDTKAQNVYEILGSQEPSAIKTENDIRVIEKRYVRFRRRVYWRTLFKFLMWNVWSLAISTTLLWTFQSSAQDLIMFFAYILAYTGLVWCQYTKIFAGPYALKPLIIGICTGLPVGIALKASLPNFLYSQVIGLGVATWIAALLSLWSAAGMAMPSRSISPLNLERSFHAFTAPWDNAEWSQHELQGLFDNNLLSVPTTDRFGLNPVSHPAIEIKNALNAHKKTSIIEEAFPNPGKIVDTVLSSWETGKLYVELVPNGSLGPGIRALACKSGDQLVLMIGIRDLLEQKLGISVNCQVVAETLIHTVSEMIMDLPHEYAVLSESIITGGVSHTIVTQLCGDTNSPLVAQWAQKELIRQLCLGLEPDLQWDTLPADIRSVFLHRCLGEKAGLTASQRTWLQQRVSRTYGWDLDMHVARCNLGVDVATRVLRYVHEGPVDAAYPDKAQIVEHIPVIPRVLPMSLSLTQAPFSLVYHKLGTILKFTMIALVADAEFQRELDYVTKPLPMPIRVPAVFTFTMMWNYSKYFQDFCLSAFLFHRRKNIRKLWNDTKGLAVHIKKNQIITQNLDGTLTAFKHRNSDGGFKLYHYTGLHMTEPKGLKGLVCISVYSSDMLLLIKQDLKADRLVNEYHYDYEGPSKKGIVRRIPLNRRCIKGENHLHTVRYSSEGLVKSGSYMKDGDLVRFKYHHRKNSQFGDELLRAEFLIGQTTCEVAWCAPPRSHPERLDRWIPYAKVTEAKIVQGSDIFEGRWSYDHKLHPCIYTTLNGCETQTPSILEHDLFGILSKPKDTSFIQDNPFFFFGNSLQPSLFNRVLGLTTRRFAVSTSHARSILWKAWKDRNDLDGITVRWMDDQILRNEGIMAPYWRHRDWGGLTAATKYLDIHGDTIMASVDLEDNVSSWTPLAVKISDLFNFGPGGDSVVTTRSRDLSPDTEDYLHVMAADTGTWPNEGGGVSACRRDMVNCLRSIKWHMLCESANDFGIPKYQIERNIQSLKIIPLWGLDFLTPTHGLFHNRLDAQVDDNTAVSEVDIKVNFIPILTALVKGARAVSLSRADIKQITRALVNLNTYFQESRHWSLIWNSEFVKQAWRDLWLSQDMPNAIPSTEWLNTELPTLTSFGVALELWYRYLFIFSIPVPEKIPDVFQASHHSVSASYGVVCKIKRNCTLQIWDHAISWRESNLCLSSALSKLSPFVRNSLLGLMRITSVLALHHADVILPCADFFNPGWETEIGTCQGTIEHRNTFRRKIDPVVNGITDMQKFKPVDSIKSTRPTVTMLSHVWFAKDIKTALLAADIIINQWKFSDYHLDIYGAINRAPTYSTECQEIIASKGLRGRVTLRGTADPMKVLENTWLFLNSSLSEGLPLALGEAALTGAPVVCTDVGASLRVLSDPNNFSRFSAVVAPNDALSLAKAQISMLALLGEWSQYAEGSTPAPILTSSPSTEVVEAITRRMYEKSPQCRALGMKTRQIVQESFSGERYLREHEQMLWIGKFAKMMSSQAAGTSLKGANLVADEAKHTTNYEKDVNNTSKTPSSWHPSTALDISTTHKVIAGHQNDQTEPITVPPAVALNGRRTDTQPASDIATITTRRSGISPNDKPLGAIAPPQRLQSSFASLRSQAGHDQVRGLRRDDLLQYRNPDVNLIMSQDFLRSGMLWSG
ncbi:Glycosyl transferase family 1 [Penicillium angulare]|uniref:Glycosyl transferase family 1 n=1 Tax=Penicillium angulare TaxID=116970 RepID=UPI0025409E39|nr:Glycosyl transferase family 1 [Penicillium angulare]KAJ5288588.1 Glycosyl transferase family 1 [Penicillium angulare]